MSIIKNTYDWRNSVCKSDLSSTTKFVLLVLANYMSPSGENCFPSFATIAKDASLHRATVIRAINTAIEKGWILKEHRIKDGIATSNVYRVNVPGVVAQDDQGSRTERLGVVAQDDPNKPLVTNQRTNQSSCIIGDDTCNPETQNKPTQSNSPPIDSAGKRKRVKVDYSSEFEELWKLYPRRTPNDCKDSAFKAYNKRLKDGYTHDEMMVGVKSYLSYVKAVDKVGTEFVKMAATFLGPKKDFLKKWPIPEDKKNGWEGVL